MTTLSSSRLEHIRAQLQKSLSPSYLEVLDESPAHIGHAGAQSGAGHFAVIITSEALAGLSRVKAHQKIYSVLAEMIPHEIHALRISIKETE